MAVVDYTSSLVLGPNMSSFNDKYCVLGAGDVVTVSFSGIITQTTNAYVAEVPLALRSNVSNIFFTGFNHTRKTVVGCRMTSNGQIIVNNSQAGDDYWIGITYVKRP